MELDFTSLSSFAEKAGRTPFYLYDRSAIEKAVSGLRSALPSKLRLHYAIKANPMPELVQFMATLVDGFDVASATELRLAIGAGMSPAHISFAGPGKSNDELEQAISLRVLINVESINEIKRIKEISDRLKVRPR